MTIFEFSSSNDAVGSSSNNIYYNNFKYYIYYNYNFINIKNMNNIEKILDRHKTLAPDKMSG